MNGQINRGLGSGAGWGASGGGHGGTGGRGKTTPKVGLPYGNMYEPAEFGSSGGGASGKAGKRKIIRDCREKGKEEGREKGNKWKKKPLLWLPIM